MWRWLSAFLLSHCPPFFPLRLFFFCDAVCEKLCSAVEVVSNSLFFLLLLFSVTGKIRQEAIYCLFCISMVLNLLWQRRGFIETCTDAGPKLYPLFSLLISRNTRKLFFLLLSLFFFFLIVDPLLIYSFFFLVGTLSRTTFPLLLHFSFCFRCRKADNCVKVSPLTSTARQYRRPAVSTQSILRLQLRCLTVLWLVSIP